MSPLVSIILPTHNRADVIEFAIRSVLAQSLEDFELLIVGDGCTDNTADVVRSFSDNRICWFDLPKAPNFGYANRNIAFRQSRGEYIGFMAHDDLVFPDHLSLLVDKIKETRTDIVYSRPVYISRDGIVTPSFFNLMNQDLLSSFISFKDQEIPASCVLHRRSCFERAGYWDENVSEAGDREFWVRILKSQGNAGISYLDIPTCIHFLASWRKSDQVPTKIYIRQQWASKAENGFPCMKIFGDKELSQQEFIWRKLAHNCKDWLQSFRNELQALSDAQSHWITWSLYEHISELQKIRELQQKASDSERQNSDRMMRQIEELRTSNQFLEHSMQREKEYFMQKLEQLSQSNQNLHAELEDSNKALDAVVNSAGWKVLNRFRDLRNRIAPALCFAKKSRH